MTNVYEVMAGSPYLTFFAAIIIIPSALGCVRFIYYKTLQFLTILFRGWPPSHINAQGDFRPLPTPVSKG